MEPADIEMARYERQIRKNLLRDVSLAVPLVLALGYLSYAVYQKRQNIYQKNNSAVSKSSGLEVKVN